MNPATMVKVHNGPCMNYRRINKVVLLAADRDTARTTAATIAPVQGPKDIDET